MRIAIVHFNPVSIIIRNPATPLYISNHRFSLHSCVYYIKFEMNGQIHCLHSLPVVLYDLLCLSYH